MILLTSATPLSASVLSGCLPWLEKMRLGRWSVRRLSSVKRINSRLLPPVNRPRSHIHKERFKMSNFQHKYTQTILDTLNAIAESQQTNKTVQLIWEASQLMSGLQTAEQVAEMDASLQEALTSIEQLEQTLKRTQGHDEQVGDLADNLPVLSDGAACYVTLTPHLSSVYEPSITVAQLDGCAVDLYRYVDGEPVFMLSLSGA